MQIRIAREKDVESLKSLLFYENVSKIPKDEEIILAEENGEIIGAVSAGKKIVRYIPKTSKLKFWQLKKVKTEAWIFRLFVRKNQRSKGVGRQLVKNMVAYLRKKGVRTIYAGIAPSPYKKASKKVFTAAGFIEAGYCVCLKRVCIGTLMKLQL